jgi:hypothetical protein
LQDVPSVKVEGLSKQEDELGKLAATTNQTFEKISAEQYQFI